MAQSDDGRALIARIQERFAAWGRREIRVPEWHDEDGLPATFFAGPFSVADDAMIRTAAGEKYTDAEYCLRVIVRKAENADGVRLFDVGDLVELRRRVMTETAIRVGQQILAIPSLGSAEKN